MGISTANFTTLATSTGAGLGAGWVVAEALTLMGVTVMGFGIHPVLPVLALGAIGYLAGRFVSNRNDAWHDRAARTWARDNRIELN